MLELLQACVKARLNIIISGGTGAGKTTLLNVLSSYIPEDERIVTIEDAAELQLRQTHVARMETRPPNIEGQGAIRIRQLVINALRMRPGPHHRRRGARRGGAGHAAGHEHGPRRLADHDSRQQPARRHRPPGGDGRHGQRQHGRAGHPAADQLGGGPVRADRALQRRHRRVTHITECVGMEGEQVTTQDILVFEKTGIGENGKVQGRFKPTGIRPKFYDKLKAAGITLPASVFQTIIEVM